MPTASTSRRARIATGLAFAALLVLGAARPAPEDAPRWWKGNTHTHTLWSDGDGAPELVVDWYREHGYDFLVLSDHDLLSVGERWFPVRAEGRLTPERLEALRERFGAERIATRPSAGGDGLEMRLATLEEVRDRFEVEGRFLLVQGEEISDSVDGKPVHLNALNLGEVVLPAGGTTVGEALERDLAAVAEQGARLGRWTLSHVNHPNYEWAVTWEDLARTGGARFFEVHNAARDCNNEGDAEHPSTEEMWDRALTARLTEHGSGPIYGIASDDTHHYHRVAPELFNAGRGWVVVRSVRLEADALVEAMRRGDFYASSGVVLRDVRTDGERLVVEIEADAGVTYRTRFVGTRATPGEPFEVGVELAVVEGTHAEYAFRGDELYVRAVVTSSRAHPRPHLANQREQAWVQPVVPGVD